MLLFITFSFSGSSMATVFADDDISGNVTNQEIVDKFIVNQYGEFKEGGKNYYYLDSVTERDAERARKESTWANIKDKLFGWTDFSGNFIDKFNSMLNMLVNIFFKINILLTSLLVIVLDFSFGFDIVTEVMPRIKGVIPSITGISDGKIGSTGLFGTFLRITIILPAAYMLYVFVLKRAFLDSLAALLKTVGIITLAILIFTNYDNFMIGANKLSNDIAQFTIGSLSGTDEEESKVNMKDTIWGMFVDRPYLYMQYGTHNIEEIGSSRIKKLMKTPNGEERYETVLMDEVVDEQNDLMVNSSVLDKMAFTPFYLTLNGFVSLPIMFLALALIILQFWFIVIAGIAPFALLIGAMPGMIGVTKRYFVELMIPLGLKVFFAFITVFFLLLSDVLYTINFSGRFGGGSIVDYIGVGIFQMILFASLFLLRKRIKNIFSSGSEMIATLRSSSAGINPITGAKKAVQGTATVAGTAVGAVMGGAAGAAIGTSVGGTLGRAVTGEASASEIATTAARTATYAQLSGKASPNGTEGLPFEYSQEKREEMYDYFKNKGLDDEMIEDTISIMEENELEDVTMEELDGQYTRLSEEGLKDDFSKEVASGIKQERRTEELRQQMEKLKPMEEIKPTTTSENAARLLHERSATESLPEVVEQLESRGLNDVSYEEMSAQFNRMEKLHDEGKLGDDFASEFARGIEDQRMVEVSSFETNEFEPKRFETNEFKDNSIPTQDFGESSFEDNSIPTQDFESKPIEEKDFGGSEFADNSIPTQGFDNNEFESTPIKTQDFGESSFGDNPIKTNDFGESTPLESKEFSNDTNDVREVPFEANHQENVIEDKSNHIPNNDENKE